MATHLGCMEGQQCHNLHQQPHYHKPKHLYMIALIAASAWHLPDRAGLSSTAVCAELAIILVPYEHVP